LGRKTGLKTQIRLKLDDEPELLAMFEKIKAKIGIQSNADLIRMIITEKYEELQSKRDLFPRFEQVNFDENGVKVLDREFHKVVQVYLKPEGIFCESCEKNDCEHIRFALSMPEVKKEIKKKQLEGWRLPDV